MIEITEDRRTFDDGLQTSAHRLAPPICCKPQSEWRVTVVDPITEFGRVRGRNLCQGVGNLPTH
jgi:hypothetical protein